SDLHRSGSLDALLSLGYLIFAARDPSASGMWGKLPTFFCSCGVPRRHVNETLEAVVNAELDGAGFDLIEMRRGGTRNRPVVEVRVIDIAGTDGAEVATLETDSKQRQVPLAAIKEARLAFRI